MNKYGRIYLIMLSSYMTFILGITIYSIGNVPIEAYEALALNVLFLLVIPIGLGFMIGKNYKE